MKRLWMTLETAIGPIQVVIVKKIRGGAVGKYSPVRGRIQIVQHTPDNMMSTLLHEIAHVANYAYTEHVLKAIFRAKGSRLDREEAIVGLNTPFLYDVLSRNRLLRLPNPPKRKK